MKKPRLTAALLPIALLLSGPAPSPAQETPADAPIALQLGPVLVHPSLSLKEAWRDNILATEKDAKSDFVTTVTPGINLDIPFRGHNLSLGGSADIIRYTDNSSEDKDTYQAGANGRFAIGDRVTLNFGDTFARRFEPRLESITGESDYYDTNTASISVKYAFVDVSQIRLDYVYETVRYDQEDFRSLDNGTASAYLYFRVLPKTSLFVEYDFKTAAYLEEESALDSTVQSGFVGATWEVSPQVNGTAKAGYLSKNYKEAEVDDFSTWVGSLSMTTALADGVTLRLGGKRDVVEGKTLDSRYYTSTGLDAELTVWFLERLAGIARVSYRRDEYPDIAAGQTEKRDDKTTSAGAGLKYTFNRWLSVDLDYTRTAKDSNIPDSSPTENAIALKITAAL